MRLSNHIAFLLSKNGLIEKEDEEIYVYGATIFLNALLGIITMLILGWISNQIVNTVVFLISFRLIQRRAGDYHAPTVLECYVLSTSMFIAALCSFIFLNPDVKCLLFLPLSAISVTTLVMIAPTQNLINPKSKSELNMNRRKMLVCLVFLLFISMLSWQFKLFGDYYFVISAALSVNALLSIMNIIQCRKGDGFQWKKEIQ